MFQEIDQDIVASCAPGRAQQIDARHVALRSNPESRSQTILAGLHLAEPAQDLHHGALQRRRILRMAWEPPVRERWRRSRTNKGEGALSRITQDQSGTG